MLNESEKTHFSDLGDDVFPEGNSPEDANPLFVVFAYIPVLCLAPIVRMGENETIRFHARQGLVLFLIEILASLFLIPELSSLFWKAVLIGCIISSIGGVLYALQGRKEKLPLIGDLADKIKL